MQHERSFRSALLAIIVLLLGAGRLHAEPQFRVSVEAANLRFGPNTTSAIVARVERGTTLRILSVEGNWVKVTLRTAGGFEKVAYIFASLGRIEEEPTATSIVREPRPVGGENPLTHVVNTSEGQASPASVPSVPTALETAKPQVIEPADRSATRLSQSQPFTRREPVVAFLLSALWPGIGQFYNGPTQQKKGLIMAGVAAGSLIMAISGTSSCDYYTSCNGSSGLAIVGLMGFVGNQIYSIYDATTTAGRLNREQGLALQVGPDILGGRTGVRAQVNYTHTF